MSLRGAAATWQSNIKLPSPLTGEGQGEGEGETFILRQAQDERVKGLDSSTSSGVVKNTAHGEPVEP